MKSLKPVFLVLTLLATPVHAQEEIAELSAAIQSGDVRVVSLRGNGNSTGAAVVGRIRNVSRSPLRIRVHLEQPLYLRNQGGPEGQNLIATRIYNRDGGYLSDGEMSFLELGIERTVDVLMFAYSVDFEKRNPRISDTFEIADMPDGLSTVSARISRYQESDRSRQTTVASQLALWMAQGVSPEEIGESFGFSDSEEQLAREILNR